MGDPVPEAVEYIITEAELLAFTHQTKESGDTSFGTVIAGTHAAIVEYLGYEIEETDITETFKIETAQDYLRLSANIIEFTSITINGATLASSGYWKKGRNYAEFSAALQPGVVVVVTYSGGLEEDTRDWLLVQEVALLMAACDAMKQAGSDMLSSYGVQGGGTTSFAAPAERNPRKYLGRLAQLQAR